MHDSGASSCRLGVDLHESRVGMNAPVDSNVEHPGERHVRDVPAAPCDQPRVLAAAYVRPEEPLAHEISASARGLQPIALDGLGRAVRPSYMRSE
jgi:hypothetical protein